VSATVSHDDVEEELRSSSGAALREAGRTPRPPSRGVLSPIRYVLGVLFPALAGTVAKLLKWLVALPDPAMVFLAGVLFTAVFAGLGPSLLASVTSLMVYNFFFVDPLYTFTVTKPQDVVLMIVFLIVAVLTSQLTARARDQAEAARLREARTAALYAFSRQIAGAVGLNDLVPVVVRHVAELFAADVALLGPAGGRLAVLGGEPCGVRFNDAEIAAAVWAWQHDESVGPDTDTLPGGEWSFVPLGTARGTVGVLALRARPAGAQLPLDKRQLLEALARQAAVAIERTRIDVVLEEKAKTEQVIEAIEDGLIVLDPAGQVAHLNEVACAILEVDREEVLGRRFKDLAVTHPHYLRLREALGDFLAHPERERLEMTLFLRGRDHSYLLHPTPFGARDGSPAGLILALQDVTYLRDQERQREQLVATLSHELGTPLTSLQMAVELLSQRAAGLDDEQRTLVDTAGEDVLRLQEVARQFLDLARGRATSIALERRQLDLRVVVARVGKLFAIQAREKGVAFEITAPVGGPIVGDETKLTWAFSNLVANALRYTPAGGHVRMETASKDGAFLVSVSDTGPGIPPDQRERIFERFTQSAAAGDIGAAGLGLAIVRDIVQAHGGRIHIKSEVGHGTRFAIELPNG